VATSQNWMHEQCNHRSDNVKTPAEFGIQWQEPETNAERMVKYV
jgi:hypothetical protein